MLNAEILLRIYKQCDLECCTSLSQVCSESHALFNCLDESFLRDKVQERVPWFVLRDSDASTWQECARILVSRTDKALNDTNLNLYLLKDVKVAVYLGCNEVVHCDDDDRVEAVFEGLELATDTELKPGTNGQSAESVSQSSSSDKFTAGYKTITALDIDLDDYEDIESNSSENECTVTSPSGVKVRNHNGLVEIIGENDKLIHARFASEEDYGVEGDFLIHKEYHKPRDSDGALVVSEKSTPLCLHTEETNGGVIHLLPGVGGALVMTHKDEFETTIHKQMLFYVLPNKKLTQVLICALPPSLTYVDAYSDTGTKFYTFYNGYLFVYLSGRLIRLWVDLGYRSEFINNPGLDDRIPRVQNRCLTVWNRDFPLIGSFPVGEIESGFRIERTGLYVTNGGARRVGDLRTGKTFICEPVGDIQDEPKWNKDFNRELDLEYTWELSEEQQEVEDVKMHRRIEARKKIEEVEKVEKLRLEELKSEQKREEKRLRMEKREEKEHQKYARKFEEVEKRVTERRRAEGLDSDGDDEEVYEIFDKEYMGPSYAIDTESPEDVDSENSHTGETGEEEDQEYDSLAEYCKENFGEHDADDWWARAYEDRDRESERQAHRYSSSEDGDEEENVYDYCEYFEKPVIYKNLYRELPQPELNPSTMNAPAAYRPVYHRRNGKPVTLEPREHEPDREYWRN